MYCPQCRTEYQPGFAKCSDCEAALVEELPTEDMPEYVEYAEALSTFNPGDISFLKSLLDSEDITYYFLGELFIAVRPLVEPARLMVKTDQVAKVKEILKDLKLDFFGGSLNLNTPTDDPDDSP